MRVGFPLLCAISLLHGSDDAASIVALARTAAPEFFADAVIKLTKAGRIPTPELQRSLLEGAFAAAAKARQQFPQLRTDETLAPDTTTETRIAANSFSLDAFSLRTRIIVRMSAIDPPRAWELFDSLTRPTVDPLGCHEFPVSNRPPYFNAMLAVAPVETGQGELIQFIHKEISRVRFALELQGVAGLIEAAPLFFAQRAFLLLALADKKSNLAPASSCPSIIYVGPGGSGAPKLPAPRYYDDFDGREAVTEAFRKVQILPSGGPRFAEDKNTPEWRDLFDNFLREWESWQPTGSVEDAFHQKASLLLRALNATQQAEHRFRLLQSAAAFLATFGIERRVPAEWLWRVRSFDRAAGADPTQFRNLLRDSGNVDLALFVALSEVR